MLRGGGINCVMFLMSFKRLIAVWVMEGLCMVVVPSLSRAIIFSAVSRLEDEKNEISIWKKIVLFLCDQNALLRFVALDKNI